MRVCTLCGQRVYAVQNAEGERFLIGTFTGKRRCEGLTKSLLRRNV